MPSQRPRRALTSLLAMALLCVLGCCVCVAAWALDPNKAFAQYVANNWSIQEGLPQISVLSIAQDRDGYLWVGTQGGLTRFDGVRFTSFTPDSEPQLPGVWVRALLVDRDGKLWIGTYKGLAVYANGRFAAVPTADPAAHSALDVYALAQLDNGAIIVATSDGVMRVDGDRLVDNGDAVKPALSLLPRDDGLWIGTTGAVVRVAQGHATEMPLPQKDAAAAVTRLVVAQGRIWAGTSRGLFLRVGDDWVPFDVDPDLGASLISTLFEDHDRNLWVGTNAKLARLRDGRLVESTAGGPPFTYKNVTAAFEDREGNLWFGSQVDGLARLWNGWTLRYSVDDGLNDRVVWSLSKAPDGTVWVGSSNGINVFEHGHFRNVMLGNALPHPHAYNLLAEADRLWIGTRRGLVVWRDGRLEAPALFAPMASAQINGIVREPGGMLWFPTIEGLFRLTHEGQPDAQLHLYAKPDGLTDIRVRVIQRLRDGRLLIGTQGGLFEMHGERFDLVGADSGLPRNIDVTAIHQLPSGALTIGTFSEQLYVFDNQRWFRLGPAQGLPSNTPFFITEDDRNYLWIAGIRGIGRVPLEDIARYGRGQIGRVRGEMVLNERGDRNAGQQGYCCNGAGMSKGYMEGHVMWLPSRDGVVALDTHGIIKNPLAPKVVIERVEYLGVWHAASDMPNKIGPDARDLAFEFTAPSFQDPRSIQIRYRLSGYDKAWHELDDPGRRRANYTNLPPGNYVFEVMGSNNAGVWNPQPATLRFRIQPWFHETWLFLLLLAGLLGVLIYAGFRYELQRHTRQRARLEGEVQARTLDLHAANVRLEKASQTDPLTGLRNRRYLSNQIPDDLAFYDRERARTGDYDKVLVFALVDIDFFKHVNDNYGHHAGDQVLQQVAHVLSSQMRSGDYLARWGGEEFLLVFRPMPSRHLEIIGNRIHGEIAAHTFEIDKGTPLRLTCSVGLAEYPLFRNAQETMGWEQMVEMADAALYWVKHHGRNGWAAFRPTSSTDLSSLLRELHDNQQSLIDSGRLQVIGSQVPPIVGDAVPPQG